MKNSNKILPAIAFALFFAVCLCADGIMDMISPIEAEKTEQLVVTYDYEKPSAEPIETPAPEHDYSWIPLAENLAEQLVNSCEEFNVPLELAIAVMEQESNFQVDALNETTGCYGLMQLNPLYFPSGLSPEENIRYGVEYLGILLSQYGSEAHAATAYFYGPTDTENSWYSDEVIDKADKWRDYNGNDGNV